MGDTGKAASTVKPRQRNSQGPLVGLKVLDIATLIAAPTAATFLADFGADVIKVELPGSGDPLRTLGPFYDGKSLRWSTTGRNKRSATADFHKPEGQAIVKDLIREYDVVLENYRPGVLEGWNLSYEQLRAVNPRVILLSITAYGQTGPSRNKPGFGRVIEALSGVMSLTGFPGGPPLMSGFLVVDRMVGIMGALSVMMAVYERERSGEGQWIDLAVAEGVLRVLEPMVAECVKTGKTPTRTGNRNPGIAPGELYESADGRWLFCAGSTQRVYERMMRTMGREDLITDPRFATNAERIKRPDEINKVVADWFAKHTLADAIAILEANEVPLAPVNEIGDVVKDPQHIARGSIISVDDPLLGPVAMPGPVPKFSRTPGSVWSTGPYVGEHAEEIFGDLLGYSPEQIAELRAKGAI